MVRPSQSTYATIVIFPPLGFNLTEIPHLLRYYGVAVIPENGFRIQTISSIRVIVIEINLNSTMQRTISFPITAPIHYWTRITYENHGLNGIPFIQLLFDGTDNNNNRLYALSYQETMRLLNATEMSYRSQ
jgi:hypothetical protein